MGRTIAWLGNFRRLVVRWERYPRMFGAFVHAALMFVTLRILARVVGS